MHKLSGWLIIVLILLLSGSLRASENYKFRIYLKDKAVHAYSANSPEAFLSKNAIDRKQRMGSVIDESDFPISTAYLDTLRLIGTKIITSSKWFNTTVVESKDSCIINKLKILSFVDSVKCVWKGPTDDLPIQSSDTARLFANEKPLKSVYGYAEEQIKLHNGQSLHKDGFRGKGIRIAVIDAGFMHVDRIGAFDSLQLAGSYNFVSPQENVFYADSHGTKVLSCLAANLPGVMVGTAPQAEYWLLKSEDNRSEFPVEEDYWIAAVEFADSVGVDIITSSLGYFSFDNPSMEYGKEALDGKTALISQAASKAEQKGLLLLSSAGNEGSSEWEKTTFPADAPTIITVGAITKEKIRSTFSSKGYTSDLRVKPDVVAMGTDCCVIDEFGNIRYANGTSFATPILAGLAACLWQALPQLNNNEIRKLLTEVSHQYNQPDVELGYGIPDVYKAYSEHKTQTSGHK